jgi:hypothetical protein
LLSSELARVCTACTIDRATRKLERPSDHAPVMVEVAAEPSHLSWTAAEGEARKKI